MRPGPGCKLLRGVLLDAAGTLIRLREPVGVTYSRIAAEHGVTIPPWRLDDAFARVLRGAAPMPAKDAASERAWWQGIVRATFRAADQMQTFTDFGRCFGVLFDHYAGADAWLAAPDAHPALDALRSEGLTLCVASNFDRRLPGILTALDLATRVDRIWLPCDAGTAKPDPAFFRGACERLGLAPEACVSIGDDPEHDLDAARAAGLAAIDVRTLASLGELPRRIRALAHEEHR